MLLENMTEEQKASAIATAKEISEYLKNPNAEKFKGRFEEVKSLSPKEREESDVDYIFELFSESENLIVENNRLKQQLAKQQAMIEQLEQKLAAIGTILAKETDAVPAEISAG